MGSVSLAEEGLLFVFSCLKEFGGQTYFVGFFLTGLLYVWIRGGEKERHFFCRSSLFLAVTIYNPIIANTLIRIMGMSAEYYRFFWILPIGLLLAYVCVELTEMPRTMWGKRGMILFLILLLLFSGNPVVSSVSAIKIPTNKYKIPDELLAICDVIHEDAGDNEFPKSVFEYEYNTLVRQYDGHMRLTLDRDVYLLALGSNTVSTRNLSEEEVANQNLIIQVIQNQNLEIDPLAFAEALNATETEYLVISENSPAVLAYLTSAGCVSFADTGQYIIFRYENSGATT